MSSRDMMKDVLGQVVGIASISVWLAFTVYFMSRAAEPNVSDSGNWFVAFALIFPFRSFLPHHTAPRHTAPAARLETPTPQSNSDDLRTRDR